MDAVDFGLMALRAWLAVVMVAHGVNHGRSLDGTAAWFESKGFKRSRTLATLSSAGEVSVGLGLLVGFLTPFAAAGLLAVVTTAFWSVHRFSGFFVFARPDEGYEYVATLAVAALVIAVVGPGSISVDHWFGLEIGPWWGALIAGGGVAAAFAQLAILWTRPIRKASDGS